MGFVDAFLANAASIFEAAEVAARGSAAEDWTILLTPGGGMHMVASSDWALDALAAEHGAESAYRVAHSRRGVSVEGRSGGRTCRLQAEPAGRAARIVLGI